MFNPCLKRARRQAAACFWLDDFPGREVFKRGSDATANIRNLARASPVIWRSHAFA